jgi:hypothetical protein
LASEFASTMWRSSNEGFVRRSEAPRKPSRHCALTPNTRHRQDSAELAATGRF